MTKHQSQRVGTIVTGCPPSVPVDFAEVIE